MDTLSGVLGLPVGVKEQGKRVDFRSNDFILLVETKGYRVAWSRAALCPCAPNNDQTEQPDPNCSTCRGSGWLYFAPANATVNELLVGELDPVQTRIANDQAAVIRSIMTGITGKWNQYDPIGTRLQGTMNATVRFENVIGYHDRITHLDSTIAFAEVLDALDPGASLTLKTRYPVVTINLLRSEAKQFIDPTDFTISSNGDIVWVDTTKAPTKDTRLTVHYLCHPTWLVVEHPHTVRLSPVKFKTKKPDTPAGNAQPLPVQALLQYEFLPSLT
jgi:hypothetical protein